MTQTVKPWNALWALLIGFFMIMMDGTIVNVAYPSILRALHLGHNYDSLLWVSSGYLLAYAVPLLIAGRLGDRFGYKTVYQTGLIVFVVSSLLCGISGMVPGGGLALLVAARVLQGIGAALISPQTLAIVTRIFPAAERSAALGYWGATAGIATLVGPILGGFLVDSLGWEWIFFINVPIGIIGWFLASRSVPSLPTTTHRFDLLGVLLSALGLFLLVFGLQQGQTYHWGQISGLLSVPLLMVSGLVVLILFVLWQARNPNEPLLPLSLFRSRNFSVSNAAVVMVGAMTVSLSLPLVFYFQTVRGLSPTVSALMMAPMAIISGLLSPRVGKLLPSLNPRNVAVTGMLLMVAGLAAYALLLLPSTSLWLLLLPSVLLGLGNACIWGPLSSTATRDLAPQLAGAGSGIYNTARQIGSVVGSAVMASIIQNRMAAQLTGITDHSQYLMNYSHAMSQVLLLPIVAAVIGALIAAFLKTPVALKTSADLKATV